jgi:hypothetical protein
MLDRGGVQEPNSAKRIDAFTKYAARACESRPKASAVTSKANCSILKIEDVSYPD